MGMLIHMTLQKLNERQKPEDKPSEVKPAKSPKGQQPEEKAPKKPRKASAK